MADWIVDHNGNAALILDFDCIRNNQGKVVAWISGNNVYNVNGDHAGWFEGGILYDRQNLVLGFLRNATGPIPYRPGLGGTPGMPGFAGRPGRPGFAGVPGRPGRSGWSRQNLKDYY